MKSCILSSPAFHPRDWTSALKETTHVCVPLDFYWRERGSFERGEIPVGVFPPTALQWGHPKYLHFFPSRLSFNAIESRIVTSHWDRGESRGSLQLARLSPQLSFLNTHVASTVLQEAERSWHRVFIYSVEIRTWWLSAWVRGCACMFPKESHIPWPISLELDVQIDLGKR